jgi:hypothetical protein
LTWGFATRTIPPPLRMVLKVTVTAIRNIRGEMRPKHSPMHRSSRVGGLLLLSAVAACGEGDPTGPVEEPFSSLTVDASTGWAFVGLAATASEVQVADPATSTAWDIAFNRSSVMLNGGGAGPSDVEVYCICQNEGATADQVLAMSAASEAAAFEAVTAASLPADENLWLQDELATAIEGWWSYDMATHVVTPVPDQAWKVRTAEGTAYAKLRVAGFVDATQAHAGKVTLEFATQAAAGAPLGPTQSLTVDLADGPVYVDLLAGTEADASDWDLLLDGWTIRLNSGISGSGNAGAIDAGEPFDDITDAGDAGDVYKSDDFGGAFDSKPWYSYNLEGNHQIWPNFNVYLVRTGGEIFKLQLTSYYEPTTGAQRHISFRYAPLD